MLQKLSIQNYALIDTIEWDVVNGWTVLTGETGSGKSILLGALGLVLGDRAEGVEVRGEKCIVEAVFHPSSAAKILLGGLHEGQVCILRRSISKGGRSRAYVNDEPVKLQFLRSLAPLLVDLHGQQDGQRLHSAEGLLHAVDAFSDDAKILADQWRSAHQIWLDTLKKHRILEAQGSLPEADSDYLSYQIKELEQLDFADPALENLEEQLSALSHAKDIQAALHTTHSALQSEGGALDKMTDAERTLEAIASVHKASEALLERVRSCRIELADLAQEAETEADNIELDPSALAKAEANQDRLQRLFDKHRVADLSGLQTKLDDMTSKLKAARDRDGDLAKSALLMAEQRLELDEIGGTLHNARNAAAQALCSALQVHLQHLKMPSARLHFDWSFPAEPESAGPSRPILMFTGNAGLAHQPLAKVASGGERSRVMLAMKATLASHLEVPTLILDEIDAGVSGDVAARMADLISSISEETQVITISHLPQVAGRASHHFKVMKTEDQGRTVTHLLPLNPEERIEELAAMLSGSEVGEAARAQARSLMG
jgi:DNA repair protein RecN (Recombination protein N)